MSSPSAATSSAGKRRARAQQQQLLAPSSPLPRVVLLDLDGTLIGRITCAVCEYELANVLTSDRGERSKALKGIRDVLVSRLRYGIIRPHVETFLRSLAPAEVDRSSTTPTELFVYTASDTEWASFIVPCVEAALSTRFNRPIFSRTHCIPVGRGGGGPEYRKSIARVLPMVFRGLRKRYPGLASAKDLVPRTVLVDNTAGVMLDAAETPRLVVCPTYAYNYVYDVLAHVDVNVLHRRFARIVPILVRAGLFPAGQAHSVPTYQKFAAVYYGNLAKLLNDTQAANEEQLHRDRFWERMVAAVRSVRDLSDSSVRALNAQANPSGPATPPVSVTRVQAATAASQPQLNGHAGGGGSKNLGRRTHQAPPATAPG
jgi:hypothetical protein